MTVLQRFEALGLAYSNPVLQLAGQYVAIHLSSYCEGKVRQREGNHVYYWVNDYNEQCTPKLDFHILYFVNHGYMKGKQLRAWWKHYKGIAEMWRLTNNQQPTTK